MVEKEIEMLTIGRRQHPQEEEATVRKWMSLRGMAGMERIALLSADDAMPAAPVDTTMTTEETEETDAPHDENEALAAVHAADEAAIITVGIANEQGHTAESASEMSEDDRIAVAALEAESVAAVEREEAIEILLEGVESVILENSEIEGGPIAVVVRANENAAQVEVAADQGAVEDANANAVVEQHRRGAIREMEEIERSSNSSRNSSNSGAVVPAREAGRPVETAETVVNEGEILAAAVEGAIIEEEGATVAHPLRQIINPTNLDLEIIMPRSHHCII